MEMIVVRGTYIHTVEETLSKDQNVEHLVDVDVFKNSQHLQQQPPTLSDFIRTTYISYRISVMCNGEQSQLILYLDIN